MHIGVHVCLCVTLTHSINCSQSGDRAGKDGNMCTLSEYFGGQVLDDDICGAFITPYNLGNKFLTMTVGGSTVTIGELYSYSTGAGM